MLYTEVLFRFSFTAEWQHDLFLQGLADMGFESFDGERAYIATASFNENAMRRYAEENGQEVVAVKACRDENWNAEWEAQHQSLELPYGIVIHPDGAFGTGGHGTTAMMLDAINADMDELVGKKVLDMGCGTGVLGIMAAKQGAAEVTMVDIDDRAVRSAAANAKLNSVNVQTRTGSTLPDGVFDYILANIHRNILISLMPAFAAQLSNGGKLLLSGFYEEDIPALISAAGKEGLMHIDTLASGEWRALKLTKTKCDR